MQKVDWKQVGEKHDRGVEALQAALGRVEMFMLDAETISLIGSALSLLSEVHEVYNRDEIRRSEWFAANADVLAEAEARGCILTVGKDGEMTMYDRTGAVVEFK